MRSLGKRVTSAHAAFAGIFVVTMLGLVSIGATLPVLPRYVKGPVGAGDVAVGVVLGSFAITGLACRPLAGHLADRRGRKLVVIVGAIATTVAGLLYFVPAGVGGLVVARLFLGAGEGMVYTAGSAWVVDLSPADRRGRIIGLYGLAIWGGLSLWPPMGEAILSATNFEGVWAFAAAAPLLGALIASRIPESYEPRPELAADERKLISREALRPGIGLSLAIVGYATVAAFIVLHLDERGVGHGAAVFTAFAVSVVTMRVAGGWLPDRFGSIPCAIGAAIAEATGLVVLAEAAAIGGYEAAFLLAAAFALGTVVVALSLRATIAAAPVAAET